MDRAGTVRQGLRDPRRVRHSFSSFALHAVRSPGTPQAPVLLSSPSARAPSGCGGSRNATATTRKGDHRV